MFLHMLLWLKATLGLELHTIKYGRGYSIEVFDDDDFMITPDSTQKARLAHRKYGELYYTRFIETGSEKVSDYADIGWNASYFVPLFKEFARHFSECRCGQATN